MLYSVVVLILGLWVVETVGWSPGRFTTKVSHRRLSRRFGHGNVSPATGETARETFQQNLPLVLLSPVNAYKYPVDHINKISRSRLAEVQWAVYERSFGSGFDPFEICNDLKAVRTSHPMRRVAWIGDPRNDDACPFNMISTFLNAPDLFLWVSNKFTDDLLDYFLQGHLTPAAIRKQNYAMFTQWLDEFHGQFLKQFQNECRSPAALRKYPNRSISDWLSTSVYTDNKYATFGSYIQALEPPIPTWSMPPVPPDRRELPLILQDIDGCLYPIDYKKETKCPQYVFDRLNQWSRNCTAEVRWMTYRGQRAVTEFAPSVGLDTFEHGRDVFIEDPNKEVQLLRWIDRNPERKIVWIDDEIHRYLDCCGNTTLVDQLMKHPNLLMVQPKAAKGVTKKELRKIDAFLAGTMAVEEVLAQNERIVTEET